MTSPTALPAVGPKVLLFGAPNTGKTYSTTTLAARRDLRIVHLLLEPTALPSLLAGWRAASGDDTVPPNVHWHVLSHAGTSLDELAAVSEAVKKFDGDALAAWKSPFRAQHDGMTRIMQALKDFPSDRDGSRLGSIAEWDSSTILVIDSLSALCDLLWAQCYGGRLNIDPREYTTSQSFLDTLLNSLCWQWKCGLVVIGHSETRAPTDSKTDTDRRHYPVLIGGKLRNTFGRFFQDIVFAKKVGPTGWAWDNQGAQAVVRSTNLPPSMNHKPDFRPLLDAWAPAEAAE